MYQDMILEKRKVHLSSFVLLFTETPTVVVHAVSGMLQPNRRTHYKISSQRD